MNMKTNNNIQDKINDAFNSIDTINEATVSPFFKDKTMQLLFAEKEDAKTRIWSWFTPQIQLATLMVIVALNVFTITQLDSSTSTDELDEFAQTYSLTTTEYQSLYN